ncbi:MAG: hypothetical protein M5R41_07485 [Bacteroidia bacterium]|nr:hypothetical protein [Bacteroidia bacterium]
MTAEILQWPEESLERKAYAAAAVVPALEPNDTNRLGYHLYLFLKGDIPSLQDAVHLAQARTHVSTQEVMRLLAAALESSGAE